ncbi:hypothetical protein [Luteibacter yeojuensis]
MNRFLASIATSLLLAAGCAPAAEKFPSISDLNAHREDHDGERMTLRGYLVLGEEQQYIVSDPKSYTLWSRDSNCLSLLNAGIAIEDEKRFNGKLVEVTGVFRKSLKGIITLSACGDSAIDIGSDPGKNIVILDQHRG